MHPVSYWGACALTVLILYIHAHTQNNSNVHSLTYFNTVCTCTNNVVCHNISGFLSQIFVLGYIPIGYNAVIIIYSSRIEISNVTILNVTRTYGPCGGAALSAFGSTVSFHGVNVFTNNTIIECSGGALHFSFSNVTFYGETLCQQHCCISLG